MPIYLVQHALSLSKEVDPEKGISEEGRADAERIAEVAKGYQVQISQIQHSGKKRARQTAEIFAAALNAGAIEESPLPINPLDDVQDLARALNASSQLMIVGHLPHLERLASWLIVKKIDHPVFKFQNGGIVCLDKIAEEEFWHIKWTLMPNIG